MGMTLFWIIGYAVLTIATAIFAAVIAESKGYKNSMAWLAGALFFPVVVLLAVIGIAPREDAIRRRRYLKMTDKEIAKEISAEIGKEVIAEGEFGDK
jgi:hypothetical protein